MKNQIPEFLQEKLKLKGYALPNKFPEEIKQFMLDYANFYNWDVDNDLKRIFSLMYQGITKLPRCGYCGCSKPVQILWNNKLSIGCTKAHAQNITNIEKYGCDWNISSSNNRQKREYTCLQKLGVKNPFQSKEIQNKIRETNLDRYGVENVSQNKDILLKKEKNNMLKYGVSYTLQLQTIQTKIKNTIMDKYGVNNVLYLDTIKQKIKETNLLKYGVENIFKSNEFKVNYSKIKEKIKQTNLKRYGVEHHSQSSKIQHETQLRNMLKYGVSHPMQIPEIAEKQQKACYNNKEYVWKTGEISILQGNEPIILKELEESGLMFSDVLTNKKDMPIIEYIFKNSTHRYYPDIYIPKENLIIEVKSIWTLKLHWVKNQIKFNAVKTAGFNFKLEIR